MSAWKPKKEKPLTLEEALELAKKEFAPHWFNSPPLFAALKTEGGAAVYPLEKSFAEKTWAVFVLDPLSYGGESTLAMMKEWIRRYQSMDLEPLLAFRLPCTGLKTPQWIKAFLRKYQFAFPAVLDSDGMLVSAFGATSLPKVIIFRQGKIALEQAGPFTGRLWQELEEKLQKFLWTIDPGSAMAPVYAPKVAPSSDALMLDLGEKAGQDPVRDLQKAKFPGPGFAKREGAFAAGAFSANGGAAPGEGVCALHGGWIQDGERIASQDPHAWLELKCVGTRFGLIAQSLNKENKAVRALIEFNGKSLYESIAGEDIGADDEGKSLVRFDSIQFYHLLENVPASGGTVTLRFQNADRCPIAIYGIRFGT